ncbi:hypothetical protein JGU66_01610 [Myxococcaceae bacterium JPH2]|nr:hypothetical protein [Myxococcaceae bacterium JPH2]
MPPDSVPRPESAREDRPARRTAWRAGVLGAALLVAGVGWWAWREPHPSSAQHSAKSSPAVIAQPGETHRAGAGGNVLAETSATAAPRRFDAPPCWQDLERFNSEVTLGTFREWAAPMLRSGDALVREYLQARLAELIGRDAARAGEVLDWAREAPTDELEVLLSGLKDSEAVHLPQVAARLTAMSLDASLEAERRTGLLLALETQRHFEPAVLTRLTAFAKDPASGEAGWVATRTLGTVMAEDAHRTGEVRPYLDSLLTVSTESPDEQIRYLALTMPLHADPVLDAKSTERYARILTSEGSEDGRQAAAHDLSLAEDKAHVLDLYAKAFPGEQNVCVRWAIFRFAARAAGRDALPVMATMALVDPRFQPTYQDFERIYASGVLDFERVWLSLSTQDPFGCLHHDE